MARRQSDSFSSTATTRSGPTPTRSARRPRIAISAWTSSPVPRSHDATGGRSASSRSNAKDDPLRGEVPYRTTKKDITLLDFASRAMARDFFTMDDFNLSGRTVLLRVDINSPIDPSSGRLLNDARLRAHLTTIRDLRGAKVAILAHQSRPGKDDFTTLEAHAERLQALLGRPVRYVDSLYGRHALEAIQSMEVEDVVVLENTRFYAEDESLADAKFEKMATTHMVRRLAPLADYFVLDAFAAAHRAQPSLVGFCEVLPTLAGRVMEKELTMLGRALASEERPKVAIFGGIKADDSLAVTRHMLEKGTVDRVLTTGGVALLFLDAQGVDLGKPTRAVLEKEIDDYADQVAAAKTVLAKFGSRIELPVDLALNVDGKRVE